VNEKGLRDIQVGVCEASAMHLSGLQESWWGIKTWESLVFGMACFIYYKMRPSSPTVFSAITGVVVTLPNAGDWV